MGATDGRGGCRTLSDECAPFGEARPTAITMAVAAVCGAVPILAMAGNVIAPDGRTATALDVHGRITDIRTGTVRGDNAFNSFHHFRVARGNTVNLHLPGGTENLINLVHDSRAVINGTLNGVLNGRIDGNVVFADPHGIVVGASGVVNVGSLLLSTPSRAFMNRIIDAGGHIDAGAVRRLLAGEAPLSADGVIRVDGSINAFEGVSLEGGGVALEGRLRAGTDAAHQALFEAAVNTDGIAQGTSVAVVDGRISIRAAEDVTVSGLADASAATGSGDGGIIRVRAGRDLNLKQSAVLAAEGAADGGDGGVIDLWADRDAAVAAGVRFDASAGAVGDGGFIEVSSGRNVTLDGLNADLGAGAGGEAGEFLIDPLDVIVKAGSTAYYTNGGDVSIVAGLSITLQSGTNINTRHVGSGDADDPATASVGDSGRVTLQAPHITVGDAGGGASIFTFATDGYNAGDITLTSGDNFTCNICQAPDVGDYFTGISSVGSPLTLAPTADVSITVESGAELDARYIDRDGYSGAAGRGGDVTLTAAASDMQVAGMSHAGASVLVNGVLRGANVAVTATADAGVDFAWLASALDPANPTGSLELLQGISNVDAENFHQNAIENADDWTDVTNVLGVLGLPVTAGVAIADANVEIGGTAVVEATGDLTVDARATRTVLGATGGGLLTGTLPELGLSVIYGHVSGTTSALVTGAAQITAGGALNVAATSENTMEVGSSAMVTQAKDGVPTKGNTSLAFSAAMGYVDVTTEAVVGADVRIHDAGAVEVSATGVDKFTTEASSLALTPTSGATAKAQGGVTAAVSLWSTDVLAAFDAQLADGVSFDSLDVIADNIAETHVTKTTVQTGNNFFDYLLGTPANRQAALSGLISGALGKAGGSGAPKFAAAASITVSEQNATARIGENAIVRADGDVTVRSRVIDQGIRSISDSRVNSTGPGAASLSGSVAFAYAEYDHASHAVIGDGAEVEAEHIGVGARSELPIDNDYDEAFADFDVTTWSGPADFLGALNTIASTVLGPDVPALESLGLSDYLLTGYSNAYGDATQSGSAIFGSANALRATQDTRAWVGEGAQLTATGGEGEWTSEFGIAVDDADELDIGTSTEWTWSAPVDVDARTLTESIGVTGNLSLLTLAMSHAKPAGKSVGGSFGWNQFDSTTIAGIGDGVVVTADALDVEAISTEHMIVIAPSAGVGSSMAGNGIFSYAQIDGVTHAGIHNGAHIDANSVDVLANERINLWAIGGAVAVSSGTSVGAAIAANSISTDTRAYIGDNSADRVLEDGEDKDGDGVADAPAADVAVADGSMAGVRTSALNVKARSEGRVGAIGVAAAAARGGGTTGGGVGGSQRNTQNNRTGNTQGSTTNNGVGSALTQAGGALGGGGGAPAKPTSNLGAAGSGTLNFSRIKTIAEVRDATIIVNTGDDAPNVNVRALTHVDQISGSGSAAVTIGGGGGGRSTAIAGALAFNDIDNETRAGLYNIGLAGDNPSIGNVDVLAASYGDVLSLGLALAAASGGSTSGAAVSLSVGMIDADTTAEIESSDLTAGDAADRVSVTGYDHSRVMVGGGAFYLGFGSQGSGGVGLAATYGRIDNDVSAYVRGSTLAEFDTLDVRALGASRILAGAVGGAVNTGMAPSGAGSLYIVTLDSNIAAGITGIYSLIDDDSDGSTPKVRDYANPDSRSDIDVAGGVTVTARSTEGLDELDATITQGGLDADRFDFDASALADVDSDQAGFDPYDAGGVPGEAMIGFAGSLGFSSGGSSAGFAVGYTDLQGGYTAEIRDSDVTAADGDVNVTALNSREAIGVAVGASVSSSGALTALGSAALTISETTVNAQVLGDSRIEADHVAIEAGTEGVIYSLAGSLSATASGTAAIGAAATYNEIGGEVNARLGGDSVVTDGADPSGDARTVDVTAVQDADIRSAAVAASATGGSAAIGGSATINTLTTKTTAKLDADAVTAATVRVSVVNGADNDPTSVGSLAGALTASANAGFGAAFAVNTLSREFSATVSGTDFTDTNELIVHSTGASEVKTLAVSGGAGGSIAAGVSDATSTSNNTVGAYVTNIDLENSDARVDVLASDASSIKSLAGAVQVGGTGGVGAAFSVNQIGNTVEAALSGGTLSVENLVLNAASNADIKTAAVGIAVGGTTGLAGSVAVNLLDSSTRASIDDGADITAQHNVGVTALSDDSVDVVAGAVGVGVGAVGGGLATVINYITSDTEAYIAGTATSVSALATDSADTLQVATGNLTTEPAVTKLEKAADYQETDLTASRHAVTGVAVNAQSLQSVGTFAATVGVSASLGSVSGAVTGVSNIVGGTTAAYVEDASINSAAGAADRQTLDVRASSHAYTANIALALAGSGGVSATGTLGADVVSRHTAAYLSGASVAAADSVDIDARTTIGSSLLSAGGAVGVAGVAGSGGFVMHDATTLAYLDGGTDVTAGSLTVDAQADNRMMLVTGALGVGVGGAAAGAMDLAISSLTTEASVDREWRDPDATDPTSTSTIDVSGATTVQADSDTEITDYAIGAAGGGGVGVAGSVTANVVENRTVARIRGASIGGDATTGNVTVEATDATTLRSYAGAAGVGLGGTGLGAGAHVSVIHSTVAALVEDSMIDTDGAVKVKAFGDTDLDSVSVAAGAGLSAGISGAASVAVIGSGDRGEANEEIDQGGDGTMSKLGAMAQRDRTGSATDRLTAEQTSGLNAAAQYDLAAGTAESLTDTTTARIDGGSVKAASVEVLAEDRTRLKSMVGSAAAGAVGVGGAVTVNVVYNTVYADIIGGTDISAPGDVTITARAENGDGGAAVDAEAYTGAAGLVGLGAAVVHASIDNSVHARMDANVNDSASGGINNDLSVTAEDTTAVEADAFGAAAGAAAAGVVVANADKSSAVDARISDSSVSDAREIRVQARSEGGVSSKAVAAAGGLLASASGAVAMAVDASDVDAGVYGNGTLKVDGAGLTIDAEASPDAKAEAFGVAVSGLISAGASVATARADSTVDAVIDGNVTVTGTGALDVLADVSVAGDSAWAKATGSTGGGLFGANATAADALSNTDVTAAIGAGATLNVDGAVTVAATNRTSQDADADSFSVGLVAVGANIAHAESGGSTTASFAGEIVAPDDSESRQDLAVRAIGEAVNRARAEAGNGGVIAGAASSADTDDTSTVTATLANTGTAEVGILDLTAQHTSDFNADVDSTQASLVGMSGAWADNDVNVDVSAVVGAGSVLRADDIGIVARAIARKPDNGYSVVSGSGGAFNAAAARSETYVGFTTLVDVGADADLRVTGEWLDPGVFNVLAENQLDLYDGVKLDAGGAIAVARAEAAIDAEVAADVMIGDSATLRAVGDLVLATRTGADVTAKANAKTYGAAGAAQGRSRVDVDADHTITVAAGADLQAYGDTRLLAGQGVSGAASRFDLTARTDLWNKTAFPVETDPDANTVLDQTGVIEIASGARVASVRDVYLKVDPGFRSLTGRGIGKDLYRKAAEDIANGLGSLVGADEVSLDITAGSTTDNSFGTVVVNGSVEAGIFHDQYLTFTLPVGFDGSDFPSVLRDNADFSEGVSFRISEESYSQNLFERLNRLYEALDDFHGSATERAAFDVEIRFIEDQLENLGYSIGLTEADMYPEGPDGGILLPAEFPITVVEVDDIIARPGNIEVRGDVLRGGGVLDAPGDASITIDNRTPAFLRLGALQIPDRDGGRIRFNRSLVENAADITAINAGGVASGFSDANIRSAADSPEPAISVRSTYSTTDFPGSTKPLPPDINVVGDVLNRRGSVKISTNEGSVYVEGDIRANRTEIGAGENVVLSYIDSFRHIGRDPAGISPPPERGATIAGNSVIVSARYINVNGLIQSGIPDWSLTIDDSTLDAIDEARTAYRSGGPVLARIVDTDPVTGTIGYRYDFSTERIVLDAVEVSGGYLELTGKIMSTGNGELRVLDGFGRVQVENSTGKAIEIAGIDLGSEIEGVIRINDAGLVDGDNSHLVSTIYTRIGDDIQVYRGAFDQVDDTAAFLDTDLTAAAGTRTANYSPRAGLDYIWLTGTRSEYKEIKTYYSDTAIGFIPSGEGTLYSTEIREIGDPLPLQETEYLTEGLLPGEAPRDGQVYVWDDLGYSVDPGSPYTPDPRHWETCETRVLVCVETRSWKEVTKIYGAVSFERHGVAADQAIDITFSGRDTGEVNITSLGDLYIDGSVFNASGTTVIDGRTVNQSDSSAVIGATDLTLRADRGLGVSGDLRLQVTGTLDAVSTVGDVNLNAVSGDLNVLNAVTGAGNVSVRAQDSLGTVAGGIIRGLALTLEARQGAIGAVGDPVRIDTGGTITGALAASGPQGVYLTETSGDLWVRHIDAGAADVGITVAGGALLDANTTEVLDQRLDAEIQALWADMDLTGADAAAALAHEKQAQTRAGQSRYERYWELRDVAPVRDADGTITGYTADAYAPDYQANFSAAQVDALAAAYGWDTPAETDAGIADLEARRTAEYHALHAEFGAGGGYDPDFQYVLSDAEIDALEAGHTWTEDQLRFSISKGLAAAPGQSTGIRDEDPNISARNIAIDASAIGRTLDETLVIDLSSGVRELTDAERRALSSAEFDDVAIDPDQPAIITIVQRDDVDLAASGHITATVTGNAFIGGEQDLNLYDVSGRALRIKTDGSVTTARPGETVLTGTDVIIEGSDGDIGAAGARLGTAIAGELTARTTGRVFLHQTGDLAVNRITGESGVDLIVSGSLAAARDVGETITGGGVRLEVSENVGAADRRVNVNLGLNDPLILDVGGDAWIGAEQGVPAVAGDLRVAGATVDGRLDIADVTDLVLTDAMTVGGLTLDLAGDWTMDAAASLTASGTVDATVADDAGLREITVTDASDDAFVLTADTIAALGSGDHLDVVGGIDLDTDGDIGAATAPLRVGASRVDATSLTGDVHLHFFRDIPAGGTIAAISGEVDLSGDGDATLDSVFALQNVRVDLAGALDVDTVTADTGSIGVDAGFAAIETGDADSEIRVTTTRNAIPGAGGAVTTTSGSQDHGVLRAGDLIELIAEGDIRFRELYAGRPGDPPATNGDVYLDAGGDIIGDLIKANRDIHVSAVGDLRVNNVTYGNTLQLDAGRNIFVRVGGDITDLSVNAGNDVELYALGVQPGSNGDILLESVTAGGLVVLDAAGDIRVLPVSVAGIPRGGFINAGDSVTLNAGGDIEVPTVTAGTDVTLDALDDIVVVSVDSLGFQDLTAGNRIDFDSLDAGGPVTTLSGGDTIGTSVRGGGPVAMTAGMRWLESGAPSGQVGASGDLILDRVEAPEVRLRSGGETRVDEVLATRVAELRGHRIRALVRDVDAGRLDMAFAGGNDGLADSVRLNVLSRGEIVFDPAYARDARIDTGSDRVAFEDGWIRDLLVLQTLDTEVLMDQLDPTARPVDVQLLELDERFRLRVDGRDVWTDAYVEHYRAGWTVTEPNFQDNHDRMGLDVGGESAARNITRTLERGDQLPSLRFRPFGLPAPPPEAPVDTPLGGTAVNLGQSDHGGDKEESTEG